MLNLKEIDIKFREKLKNLNYFTDESIDIYSTKNSYLNIAFFDNLFLRVECLKTKTNISIKTSLMHDVLSNELKNNVIKKINDLWSLINAYDYDIIEILNLHAIKIYEYCYLLQEVDYFGCCHRFTECSDNKCCTHPDKLQAKGCYYKKNLENGKIFYGKNKNI